jgi:hypothetical protein
MSPKQASGHENKLKTLNTNSDPVQFYNPDPTIAGGLPPTQSGGAQINPGLRTVSESMRQIMGQTAGMFAANMGDNPGLQSGVAIKSLQQKGDNGTIKYFKALEIAIAQTARLIVDAMPRVYDTTRQARILNADGSFEMQTLNQTIIDNQTGRPVVINDLSKGKYDVTCSAGPSFQSRMQETAQAIMEMAAFDPSVIQSSSDILFNNLDSPGMDLIAERKRQQLLMAGVIPVSQQTDEEKAQIAQMQQASQGKKDPATIIAEAEALKAQAEATIAQNKVQETGINVQVKTRELQTMDRREEREDLKLANDMDFRDREWQSVQLKQIAETLKLIREALGVDTIVSPDGIDAFGRQLSLVRREQDSLPS